MLGIVSITSTMYVELLSLWEVHSAYKIKNLEKVADRFFVSICGFPLS